MRRALLFVFLAGCATERPTRTEVAIAPPPTAGTSSVPAAALSDGGSDDNLFDAMMNADRPPHTETEEEVLLDEMMNQGSHQHPPVVVVSDDATEAAGVRAIVRRVIRQNFGQLRACHDKGLATKPGLAGRVVVRFTIDPAGKVTKAESTSATTLPSADVVACVVTAFKSFVFPQPRGGALTVDYPIVFPS